MKQENPYVISEFKNPSCKIVFQVYTRIDGKRFRKNFSTRTEAEAERQILGIQYLQETEMRVAATRLSEPASVRSAVRMLASARLRRPLFFNARRVGSRHQPAVRRRFRPLIVRAAPVSRGIGGMWSGNPTRTQRTRCGR